MIGRFLPAHRVERTVVRDVNPVARFQVGAIDFVNGLGLVGHAGTVRMGEPSSPTVRFVGELGPLQFFRGAGQLLPRGTANRQGFNTALPATNAPAAYGNAFLSALARNSGGA